MSDMDLFDGVLPFVKVAELGSFRAAAAELGLSPGAVSKGIKRLETDLGVTLFHRTTRQVRLSQEGELYLARCREAVAQVRAGRDLLAMSRREARGRVRISASFIMGQFLVRPLHRFFARYPKLEVDLRLSDRRVRLVEEEVDIAVRVGALDDSALVARKLHDSAWRLVASPEYLARRGSPETPEELAGHDAILFRAPRGKSVPITLRGGPVELATKLSIDQGELILDAAASGLGFAQVFDFMARDRLRQGELISVLDEHLPPGPGIYAITTRRGRRHPRVRAVLEFLAETFTLG